MLKDDDGDSNNNVMRNPNIDGHRNACLKGKLRVICWCLYMLNY